MEAEQLNFIDRNELGILEHSDFMFLILDRQGNISFANKKYLENHDTGVEIITGTNWFESPQLKKEVIQQQKLFELCILEQQKLLQVGFETEMPLGDKLVPVFWTGSLLRENGNVVGMLLFSNPGETDEHNRKTDSLTEIEKRYSSIFSNIEEAVALHQIVLDEKGKPIDFIWLDVNPNYEKTTFLKKENIIGKRGLDVIPSIEQKWIDAYGEVALTGKSVVLTDHSEYLDKYWEVKAFCPGPNLFAVAMTDITEKVYAQKALEESEKKYRSIIESSPMGTLIYLLNKDGQLILDGYNQAANSMLGIDVGELLGKTIQEAFPPLAMTEIPEIYKKVIETGEPWESEQVDYRDSKITGAFKVNAFRSAPNQATILFLDITEQIVNQRILQESEEKHRLILENAGAGIGYFDLQGRVILFNKQSAIDMGGKPEDFVGKSMVELFGPENGQIYLDRIAAAADSPVSLDYEDCLDMPTGKKWYLSVYNRILNSSDETIGIQVISTDITKQKLAEQELIIARDLAEESDRLKSSFLANMSHEIRTPMNGILGFTDLLKEPDLSGEEQSKYVEIIKNSGDRMLSTLNDIIDVSKIDAGQVELQYYEVNLESEINSLVSFFKPEAEKKGIDFKSKIELSEAFQKTKTDKGKFNSILSNLIKNALKFTSEGQIEVVCRSKNNIFECSVSDTGIGIPTDRIDDIFNRFVQVNDSKHTLTVGSGLGLSIVKSYVEMLDGDIRVDSSVGKGSSFCFTLPMQN